MSETRTARAVGFNHVALEVGDIEAALAFYARLFAFELRSKSDTDVFIDLLSFSQLSDNCRNTHVVPAKAGTQWRALERRWIPAFAGMTFTLVCAVTHFGNPQ